MAKRYMTLIFDEVRAETERAALFSFDDKAVWIPRSICEEPDLDDRTIRIQEWFVMREGLEAYEIE